jgi:hypothetical protein
MRRLAPEAPPDGTPIGRQAEFPSSTVGDQRPAGHESGAQLAPRTARGRWFEPAAPIQGTAATPRRWPPTCARRTHADPAIPGAECSGVAPRWSKRLLRDSSAGWSSCASDGRSRPSSSSSRVLGRRTQTSRVREQVSTCCDSSSPYPAVGTSSCRRCVPPVSREAGSSPRARLLTAVNLGVAVGGREEVLGRGCALAVYVMAGNGRYAPPRLDTVDVRSCVIRHHPPPCARSDSLCSGRLTRARRSVRARRPLCSVGRVQLDECRPVAGRARRSTADDSAGVRSEPVSSGAAFVALHLGSGTKGLWRHRTEPGPRNEQGQTSPIRPPRRVASSGPPTLPSSSSAWPLSSERHASAGGARSLVLREQANIVRNTDSTSRDT